MHRLVLLTLLSVILVPNKTSAQFFLDDFEDGDVEDGMPVSWEPLPPFNTGQFEVIDGDYVLTPGQVPSFGPDYYEADSQVLAKTYGEVTLQTQFRTLGLEASWTGVFTRANGDSTGFWATVRQGGRIVVGAFNNATGDEETWEAPSSISPVLDDLNLQFNVFSQAAEVYTWRKGDTRPESPQLVIPSIPDFLPAEGSVGVWVADFHEGVDRTPAAFRWFAATPGAYDSDFNFDARVDKDDLGLWQTGFGMQGQATPADGDADGNSDTNGGDFLIWQREYMGENSTTVTGATVPEPVSAALLIVGISMLLRLNGRNRLSNQCRFD